MAWQPHITVASVVERDGRFLLVEETCGGRVVINQPAGHLEAGESLMEAVIRETLEETACHIRPTALTGIYQWRSPHDKTYLRFCFAAECVAEEAGRPLDDGIFHVLWLTSEELRRRRENLRSPMVLRCIDDYLAGRRFPLDAIEHLA
ncbi:MAG TPA: NUDIX hydrolase [Gammaproteobacteria bacterium]|nr:NUDIX hydrolase [Gammaproteobacteria bacterium]